MLGPLTDDNRDEWLRLRLGGIGASDIASVLEVPGAYQSRFALWWAKKLGWSTPQNEAMEWGHRLEEPIAVKFAELHPDLAVITPVASLYHHHVNEWAMCTPDRMVYLRTAWTAGVSQRSRPLELKTDQNPKRWTDDGPPDVYRAQLMWQSYVMGCPEGPSHLAALVNKRYYEYELTFARDETEEAVAAASLFVTSLANNEPPDVDDSESTHKTLEALYDQLDDAAIPLDSDLVEAYDAAWWNLRVAKARLLEQENKILQKLGNATTGVDSEGRTVVKRNRFPRAGYTVKPTTITQLRRSSRDGETNE